MDSTTKTIIIVFFVVFGAACVIAGFYGANKRKKLMASGAIIKRSGRFYKDKEYLRSNISDLDAFYTALTNAARGTGVCSVSGNYEGTVVYSGRSWTSQLVRLQTDDGSVLFSYALTHFEEYRGMPKDMMDFNIILTAVERTFLQFDPNTQVTTEAIKFKSNSSLF